MAQEIELKLALAEGAQRNFLRHPLLKQAANKQSFRLINLYYDTPRLELRTRGIGLRLRAQGKLWLQTVKCAGISVGGLSARPEWEVPYVGHFDFSLIEENKVREWLERPKLISRIAPIFETNFQRITWLFEPDSSTRIVMMLDRGWIAAGGRRQSISEVEIELIQGNEAALFQLASILAERIPLAPAPLSKADRGYRLFKLTPATPFKAPQTSLEASASPTTAFRKIALSCLDHLQHNHLDAISSDDPEYIHQMRVATRRLRAALRLFGPLLPENFATPLIAPLRELMAHLGRARDLDVLQAEIAEPVLLALPDEPRLAALVGVITEQRFDARQNALRFLRSSRYGIIVLQALSALHSLTENSNSTLSIAPAAPNPVHEPTEALSCTSTSAMKYCNISSQSTLIEFAENRLRQLKKKVLKLADHAHVEDPASLHMLRIGIKRLRYALEFFSPLASAKSIRQVLTHLANLQETLGQINDLANAGELLMDCANDDPLLREAVSLIGGWHGLRHQKLLAAIPADLHHLRHLSLPKLHT